MKRIFSVFLSLALAVSLFPAALAEESAGMDRGALAQRLAELCGYADELEGYAAQPSAFSDVEEEDECRAAVNLLRDKGLMQGDGSGAFRPSVPATRADAVTVLLRWAGLTEAQIGAVYGMVAQQCCSPEEKQRYEQLLQMIDEVPKYGNDIEEVDAFAREVAYTYSKPLETFKNPRGGIFQAGLYPVSANVPLGAQTGATPDGRLAHTPVADGVSPTSARLRRATRSPVSTTTSRRTAPSLTRSSTPPR